LETLDKSRIAAGTGAGEKVWDWGASRLRYGLRKDLGPGLEVTVRAGVQTWGWKLAAPHPRLAGPAATRGRPQVGGGGALCAWPRGPGRTGPTSRVLAERDPAPQLSPPLR
jgi:hypothetical protein